jgi:hypothetical protein
MATATKTRTIRPDRFSATLQSSQNMSEIYPNLIKHKLMCLYKRHCRRGNSESEWAEPYKLLPRKGKVGGIILFPHEHQDI